MVDVEDIAVRLDEAFRNRETVPPITEDHGIDDVTLAYAVQDRWSRIRLGRGDRIVGRKIGLTSKAIQDQLGVSEPDYGALWDSSFFEAAGGEVAIPRERFIQPRIEGEIAFLVGKPIRSGDVTQDMLLDSVDAFALGVEIVDSRIRDWRIRLVDTVADNASYGGFSLGPWDRNLRDVDLASLAMTIRRNGELAAEGIGSAALGHPARSAAWLANKLIELGDPLAPGDIIISGGITKMLPVERGDEFLFSLDGQPDLNVTFV